MYKDIFTQIGLSANEAIVYEYLLKNGESPAGVIIKKTPLKRGVVYNTLADLIKKELVLEKAKDKIAFFSPNHPDILREFIDGQEAQIKKAKKTLEVNLPPIISSFNLVSGRPGVRYFEGIDGIKKVLADSLTASGTICAYSDIEAIVKYIDDINKDYVAKRDKLGIAKKGIVIDSPFAREYLKNYHLQTTYTRFIDYKLYPFNSVMQIYDGKISYITLSDVSKIGVIIEDQNIFQLHKSIHEYMWERAMAFDQLPPLSPSDFSKAQ